MEPVEHKIKNLISGPFGGDKRPTMEAKGPKGGGKKPDNYGGGVK